MAKASIKAKWDKVQEYQRLYGLSDAALAAQMGIDYTTFYKSKKNDKNLSSDFVAGLLHASGLNFNDVFYLVA